MKKQIKQRIELFKQGYSIKDVSEITGVSYKTVEYAAREFKKIGGEVSLFKKNFAYHEFFDNIDSEIKSYLLGFFLADGCIDGSKDSKGNFNNRLIFSNSIDDEEVVKLFQQEVCPKSKIYYIDNQLGVIKRKLQCRLRCTSKHMTSTLINKYNFSRQKAYDKTFKFPFETIPKSLIRHFIRGFFDGDGNVDFAKMFTKKGTETSRFQYGFLSTSLPFAKQISEIVCSITDGVSGTISEIQGKTTNWWVIRFNTYRIKSVDKRYKFYKYLYKNSTYYLKRKKIKFDSFFEYRGKKII